MRLLIIGAGEVGYHVAKMLCRDNDIFIIEKNEGACNRVRQLDVQVIQGNGTDVKLLKKANVEGSKIIDKKLKDVNFPRGAIISAIVRGKEIIIPGGNHMIIPEDKVVIFTLPSALPAVEGLFS